MAGISLRNIFKVYPGDVTAVHDLNLEIEDKEFIILVGPSGCGKSTTLRMIAGLEEITRGELYIGDRLVNDIAPKDRDIAMVFQNYALYPHMTVFQNMAFGLQLRKVPKNEIKEKVGEAARILDIEHLLDRKPKALSGGQRQRVALGRAMVRNPAVFLLDEPLSNLDAKLRTTMRSEITKLHKRLGTTFVYVTHDQTEAMTMGDRIVVMKDGLIQQLDTPQNLYDKPGNLFVAGFIGTPQMNFLPVTIQTRGDEYCAVFGQVPIAIPPDKASPEMLEPYVGKEMILGVRPENLHDEMAFMDLPSAGILDAEVDLAELMGSEVYLYLDSGGTKLIARVPPRSQAKDGDHIKIAIDCTNIHLFDKETEHAICNSPAG